MSQVDPTAERGPKPALGAYFIVPVLACALTLYFLLSTLNLRWEARSTGTYIGVILLILCSVQITRLFLQIRRGEGTFGLGELIENTQFNRQRVALLLMTTMFVVLLPVIGTTVGLFILLIATVRLMGVTSWRALLIVAFTTAATVHLLLIYLLGSQLPQGVFKNVFAAIGI